MMRKLVFVCALFVGFIPVFVYAQENPLLEADFWETAAVEDVVKILDKGADIDAQDEDGFTPLHWAGKFSKTPDVVPLLLEANADVNVRIEDGTTLLHLAARYAHPTIVEWLLDRGADANLQDNYGRTPSEFAEKNEYLKGSDVYWRLNDAQYR